MLRLGFDIGGTSVRACALDDERMEILRVETRPFPAGGGWDGLANLMGEMGRLVGAPLGLTPKDFRLVGVGVPGTVKRDTGVLLSACNLHVDMMPIADMMRERFPSADVAVANDADAAALAEYHAGAFRGYDSALLITIGTGLGGGLIVDDRLFLGGRKVGCELGHITLQQGGPMCACGSRGCAESLCSASWLLRQGRHAALGYPMSSIATRAENDPMNVTAKLVVDCAREGDGIARQIFDEYVENLASLISTCGYLIGPRIIGLGGGVSNAGAFLIEPLTERVKVRARKYMPEKIVAAELGERAGMIGAAMLP